jgi:nitrous oxidase accessory protein NosD
VVSGNAGHGLRVHDSNHITIHANFFGLGSDNQTVVANGGDGARIEGTSRDIQYGGVIPLGNVNAGNQGNGINVIDHVEDFITFNTFAGLTAFGGIAPNQKSGIRISSDGGSNKVRTNVMAGNVLHGLHITGKARDLWVDPNIIGLNTYGTQATYTGVNGQEISWGNGGDGIRVDGKAQDILIAGQRRSVIPQNTVSNNTGHGIRLDGEARRVTIDNTFVGLSSTGRNSFGNGAGGIHVGAGTRQIAIGQPLNLRNGNRISSNGGPGIALLQPRKASLFNNSLTNNAGSGVVFVGGHGNTLIGNNSSGNEGFGFAISTATASRIARNSGEGNTEGLYG